MISTTKPANSQRLTLLLCGLAYLFGAVVHLRLWAYRPGMIWGDSGDGLLSLWILRHGAEWLGGAGPLADGRIFWPENSLSFFWAEHYLLLAPVFAVLQQLTVSSFAAQYGLGVLLTIAGFAACVFFIEQVLALLQEDDDRPPPCWMAPLVSYLAYFSTGLLNNYCRQIQNLSFFWLLIMAGAMLAWASLTAVFLSAAYLAVAGVLLFAAWVWIEWFRNAAGWWRNLRRIGPAFLLGAALMGAVVFLYARAGMQPYTPEYIHSLSIGWGDLVNPRSDFSRMLLDRLGIVLPDAPFENPSFLGWGLVLAAAGWLWRVRRDAAAFLRRQVRSPLVLALVVPLVLCQFKIRELRPILSILGFVALAAALLASAARIGLNGRASRRIYAAGLLALFALLLYGIAFGPRGWYVRLSLHPSIWSVLRAILPGLAGMRAIGRMAVVAQVFAWGLLLALLWMESAARMKVGGARYWVLALLLPASLQVADQLPAHANVDVQDEKAVTPTLGERLFWAGRTGVVVVLPAGPSFRNTVPMLYFQFFPDLLLVNGYSGRSTKLLDGLVQAGLAWGEGSVKQVAVCEQAGADWIVLRRSEIPVWRIEALRQTGHRLALDGERLAVFEPLPGMSEGKRPRGYTPSTSRME